MKRIACWLAVASLALGTTTVAAEEIAVGNYGVSANWPAEASPTAK